MKNLLSQLVFYKQQRVGILFLLLVNLIVLAILIFYQPERITSFNLTSEEVVAKQIILDSIRKLQVEKKKPKIYPSNPNFMTDYKAYTLNIPTEAYDKLVAFRKRNLWVNSASEFQKVTGVSDSLLRTLKPYFKFPEWTQNRRVQKTYSKSSTPKSEAEKKDLNLASADELKEVYGIGDKLSVRIINYRKKINSFSHNLQLNEVWGLSPEVINNILKEFTVKEPKEIRKIEFSSASASDIATIPGVSFELAKKIWEYRILREAVSSVSELEKIEGITPNKLTLIELYLSFD